MCEIAVTQHTCTHTISDTFPCNDLLDGKSCSGTTNSPSSPTPNISSTKCPTCLEEENLTAALALISTNPDLAPISTTSPTSPLTNEFAKTREYFPRCGHFARQTRREFFREKGDPEWLDLHCEGLCYGCCEATPRVLERMKEEGGWWGGDPWGELGRVIGGDDIEVVAGGSVGDVWGGGFRPLDYGDEEVGSAPPPDNTDADDLEYDYDNDPSIDTSPSKNKNKLNSHDARDAEVKDDTPSSPPPDWSASASGPFPLSALAGPVEEAAADGEGPEGDAPAYEDEVDDGLYGEEEGEEEDERYDDEKMAVVEK